MEEEQNNGERIYTYKDTTATRKIFELRKRIRAVKGGTSASKTISIVMWHIDYCQQKRVKPTISTIASESFPHLDLGVIRDFKSIMKDRGYWNQKLWNGTKNFYTFETGNVLEFMSVDTYSKAHGPRRDTLYLNEGNNLPWAIVDQLIIRTRQIVWLDWNPVEDFWFHSEILPYRDDFDYITLTYKDNEALDEISISEIESHKHNTNWWNVYGLGQDGEIETRIYKGWTIVDMPDDGSPRLRVKGLDFGYSNDPTALVDVYEWNGGYLLDELLYEKGLTNPDIAKVIGKDKPITIGDSSEPKSIVEIAQHGVNIIGSKKGKGSISHGIDSVRSKKIYVTKRSLNIIKEYRNYVWLKDKNGKIINEPRDLMNHTMDAIRYAIAFLNPEPEKGENDEGYKQPEYEKPGIQDMKAGTPAPTLAQKNRKQLMEEILAGRRNSTKESSYETDTPWEKPGIT